MMKNKRVLSIQDISCLGQCSTTVALPILSVCGLETCILPTMILSTHTGGLGTPHRRDLGADLLPIADHWRRQGLDFDGICVGYLGEPGQVRHILKIVETLRSPKGKLIVDPAMADHGRRYSGIEEGYEEQMKELCRRADVLLPNLTEGYLLAGKPYVQQPDRQAVNDLLAQLEDLYGNTIILTGIGFEPGQTGFALRKDGATAFYQRPLVGKSYHGTGDMFTAVFAGGYLQGRNCYDAAVRAAEFVARVAEKTAQSPAHSYGTRFESVLPWLAQQWKEN